MANTKDDANKRVPIEYLWEGLVLSDDIYNSTGTVLLIPHGEVLSAEKIERLLNFGDRDGYITTSPRAYEMIMEAKAAPYEIRQKIYEEEFGYTTLKKNVEHIFSVTRGTARVNTLVAETVAKNVYHKLFEVPVPGVFQCIDAPRKMDEKLQRHSLNVAFFNGMMGQWLGLSEEKVKTLVSVGLMHDIGKTKIPEDILYAPRRLTDEEYTVMKRHAVYSDELLGPEMSEEIHKGVRYHHEKVDGSGYPDAISGEAIPLAARVTAIADVYDAMISQRDYKDSMIPFDVLDKFRNEEFQGLDKKLINVFVINMVAHYKEVMVQMSDGSVGVVKYIPPNDISHPIVKTPTDLRQTDENWYCSCIMD